MSVVKDLGKIVETPPSSPDEVDDVLIALIEKHALDENKWVCVAQELSAILKEPKTKQWCKNRAKKSAVRDRLVLPSEDGIASSSAQAEEKSDWRAKLGCFRMAIVECKGLGVLATKDLKTGALIIEEKPVLEYEKAKLQHLQVDSEVPPFIRGQWNSLSQEKQRDIMELHDAFSDKSLAGILRTNALSRGHASTHSVLCPGISRFNHSCSPNCQHAWDEDAHMERVFACTDIKAGEELCIYYIDLCKPMRERQTELRARYGFDCACAACVSGDKRSDHRRSTIRELNDTVLQAGMRNPRKGIAIAQQLLTTYDEEGIKVLSLYARTCYDAFQLALLQHDIEAAKEWITRAHRYFAEGEGPENSSTLQMLEYCRKPRSHRLWNLALLG